jgi:hypothetical protein
MKNIALLLFSITLVSCHTTTRLAIPTVFKEQASMLHVSGSRGNKMSFGNYSSSKIKRKIHVTSPGWGRVFFLENLYLNKFGLQKNEHVEKEKAGFNYTLSDGKNNVEIFGKERKITRSTEYKLLNTKSINNSFRLNEDYNYIFSAVIATDSLQGGKNWELIMSNINNGKKEMPKLFLLTAVEPDDYGLATNGKDTIFIKPVSTKSIESANGKAGRMPIKMLSGYELNTKDGTIAIIDSIDQNIWFYNELNDADKLMVAAITSALFARRVNDTKW